LTGSTAENSYIYRAFPELIVLKNIQKIAILLVLLSVLAGQNISAQDIIIQDTLPPAPKKHHFKSEPLKATMLAVAFPGAGQVYNRKFWKIPVVYAGFGALIYSAGFNSNQYVTYIKAYQDFTDNIPETKGYLKIIKADASTYDRVLFPLSYDPQNYSYYKDALLRMVDYYKRYRDLSYIGVAAWYLISILDANVDASLNNFDISNNLNLTVAPALMPLPGGYTGAALTASIRITF
jgi:hypothetical protein